MRSKHATEAHELSAIVRREILPGLAISVSAAALPPSCVVWAHESKLANVIYNLAY